MKYIVDIPFETDFIAAVRMEHGLPVEMKCKKHETLELYTEPDRKAIEDEVWEFAREISTIIYQDYMKCFGIDDLMEGSAFTKYSYQEAKEKYEAWLKQKDEIHVGDEVIPMDTKYDTMLVTRTWKDKYWSDCVDTIGFDGSICSFLTSKVKKTGRHFDEVEELLKKMKEEP